MYLRRIGLFLLTNVAVLAVLSIALKVFGIDEWIQAQVGIDYWGLIATAAIFGFGGAFFSLAISKWLAKTAMRVRVLDRPENEDEAWLVETVRELSRRAKIGMPEVGVFDSPDLNAFATGARRDHALVAVSTGILRSMDRDEVAA